MPKIRSIAELEADLAACSKREAEIREIYDPLQDRLIRCCEDRQLVPALLLGRGAIRAWHGVLTSL